MKILQNGHTIEILTPLKEIKEQIIRIEKAGRTCYQSEKKEITSETADKFISKIVDSGHLSVIEHSSITVKFSNVSRGFMAELTRHRHAGFSVESTRYVRYDKKENLAIAPPHLDVTEKHSVTLPNGNITPLSFEDMMNTVESFYIALRKSKWKAQDARQILPIGIKTEIIMTANFREWRHVFKVRCSKFAHWEIRTVMIDLLKMLQEQAPVIFGGLKIVGKDDNGVEFIDE